MNFFFSQYTLDEYRYNFYFQPSCYHMLGSYQHFIIITVCVIIRTLMPVNYSPLLKNTSTLSHLLYFLLRSEVTNMLYYSTLPFPPPQHPSLIL